MKVDRSQVRGRVIEALGELVNEKQVQIHDDADPMRVLGLDSEDGVDFACALSEKLDYEIPEELNPLVNDAAHRSRRVGEIVDLMCKLLGENGGTDARP